MWMLAGSGRVPVSFLPPLPAFLSLSRSKRVKNRFFLNYCTYGYTMPWWKWGEWEHFIDWMALNGIPNLRYLLIECAFSNQEARLAEASKHMCPQILGEQLGRLRQPCEVLITHLKPGDIERTLREIEADLAAFNPGMLQNNQILTF